MAKQIHGEGAGGERPVNPNGWMDGRTRRAPRMGSQGRDWQPKHRSSAHGHHVALCLRVCPHVPANPPAHGSAWGRAPRRRAARWVLGPAAMDHGPCGQWDQHPPPQPRHSHLSHLFSLVPDGKGREGRGMGPCRWDVGDSFLSVLFPVTFKWLAPKRFLITVCFSQ